MEKSPNCYCSEINVPGESCVPCKFYTGVWLKLTSTEKVHVTAYKRLLITGARISPLMVSAINAIYAKYEDFDMSEVP